MKGAKQILLYLLSTKSEGILLRKPTNLNVEVYVDASYGNTHGSTKSQHAAVTTLGGQLIRWWTRKQPKPSISGGQGHSLDPTDTQGNEGRELSETALENRL